MRDKKIVTLYRCRKCGRLEVGLLPSRSCVRPLPRVIDSKFVCGGSMEPVRFKEVDDDGE